MNIDTMARKWTKNWCKVCESGIEHASVYQHVTRRRDSDSQVLRVFSFYSSPSALRIPLFSLPGSHLNWVISRRRAAPSSVLVKLKTLHLVARILFLPDPIPLFLSFTYSSPLRLCKTSTVSIRRFVYFYFSISYWKTKKKFTSRNLFDTIFLLLNFYLS